MNERSLRNILELALLLFLRFKPSESQSTLEPTVLATQNVPAMTTSTSASTTTSPYLAANNTYSGPETSPTTKAISSGFTTKDKVLIGFIVPIVAIVSFLLGMMHLWGRRKRRHSAKDTDVSDASSEATQPYLERKAELEANDRSLLELEAGQMRYERNGDDDIQEMSGVDARFEIDTVARPGMPSLGETHELRGEECSEEIEA
ncbi:MAG: hypothetical protein ALECFALPRED_000595 [Alectoria fallacina]|uniref:Uncharacterized protein n=1 Tax=Alectoria fallacina TaxID=1903189 RepID=A0A8H3JAR4_9LECA|nr:MAG: hypothetical protein ALECFALPRED_000595 [Alectoria fallacina]